jgi:hypothetical protein
MENNTILFEFSAHDPPDLLAEVRDGCDLAYAATINRLILRHSDQFFGEHRTIHIWLTWHDYNNVSLMILLAYILLAHPDWKGAEITVYAAFPHEEVAEQSQKLKSLVTEGRIPISRKNISIVPTDSTTDFSKVVQSVSAAADLVLMGFTQERLQEKGAELLLRHPELGDVLWVSAAQRIPIE